MNQQTTINVPSGNPVRALTGLARQIALPGEYAPERFPSFPALERTAVMGFSQPAALAVPVPPAETKVLLTRQAAYPAWATQVSTSGAYYGATWTSDDPGATQVNGIATVEPKISSYLAGNASVSGALVGVAGASQQGGWNRSILGRDQGTGPSPFMFAPANWKTYITVVNGSGASAFSVGANAVTCTVNYQYWLNPGEVADSSAIVTIAANKTGGISADLALSNAWVRPISVIFNVAAALNIGNFTVAFHTMAGTASYADSGADAGTITVGVPTTPTSLLPLVYPNEFLNSSIPWSATRTTAVSMLCTNVSQVLNKAGTVLAGRINPVINNPFTVASTTIQALHPAEKAWLPLETGLYTYCPPSTDMASFWDYTLSTAGGVGAVAPASCPVYRLDNDSMVNVGFMVAGAVAEALAVTISWHTEFRTSSALFQVALSGMTLETLHQAQLALAAAGFFFENPEHKGVLSKVIAGVYKIAPYAMKALHTANPAAAHAVAAVHNAVRGTQGTKKVPVPQKKMKMPATSAKGSGIISKPAAKKAKKKK